MAPSDDGNDAYFIESFCKRHGISKATFYQGLVPSTFKIGNRTLIGKESAAAWRAGK